MAKKKQPATHDQAFLADIVANPADDTPRLVYADWLTDHDQGHRAEFIRLQCRLATLDADDPEHLPLEQREADLLEIFGQSWRPALPAWARGGYSHRLSRGFLERVSITAGEFVKRGAILFARTPVHDLELRNLRDKAPEVAASPLLARLSGLDFHENRLTADTLRVLGKSPHLGSLESLAMRFSPLDVPAAKALSGWPGLPRLRRLQLSYRGLQALEALARPGRLDSLERLEIGSGFSSAGARALADNAPALASLSMTARTFTRPVVAELVKPGGLPALTGLHVKGQDTNADTLAESTLPQRLTSLELEGPPLSPDGLAALTTGSRMARLRRFTLQYTDLNTEGADRLAAAPLDALVHLKLYQCELDAEAAARLFASPHLAGLRRLVLMSNPLRDDGAAALARSPHLSNVVDLDVGYSEIGARGASALAASPHLANLRRLRLTHNPVGDDGARALADSPYLGELHELELIGANLTDEGLRALAHARGLGKLRRLILYDNQFAANSPALREFADPARLPSLLTLGVQRWHTGWPEVLTKLGRNRVP
jgi:uncharacterized protein (TIGR02996 family)